MSIRLSPYPKYKRTGVQWLGEVPEHWDVLPNRALFTEVKERDHPDEQMLSVTITKGVIQQQVLLANSSKKDSSNLNKSAYKLVKPGEIAYNKMRAWQGAIGASTFRGIISPAYVVQRPRERAISRYFHYLFRTPAFAKEAERWSYGITSDMWSLRPEHFKLIYCTLPSQPEQTAIAKFLDHADRQINRFIRAKQKMIKLLEEHKQSLIHSAVTRGLDTNIRLKSSGVEWLGDVPEHWKIIPLKFLSRRIQTGATPATSRQIYYENGTVPWYGPSSIGTSINVGTPVRYLAESAFTDGKARLIKGPAILMIVIGATAAKMGLLRGEGATNQQITAFEIDSDLIDPDYCVYQLRYSENWLRSTASSATIPILDSGVVERLLVAIPPLDEQRTILHSFAKEIQPFDDSIKRAERQIILLREYRTRLISDVVTGKLDVRGAAANLPDESVEPETIDDDIPIEESAEEDLEAMSKEAEA